MALALYRKYRSRTLDEVVGQEHITRALSQALASGKLSHAYLFTGPKGTGKTSVARILAHQINQLPYSDESSHLDIIEIDAASNRRIDEIRDLRDKVNLAPSSAKYKVYIIDEVHMLTREAFNALLKTLEEPPKHVVFILATTELHKLPATIISRTQRYGFRPIDTSDIIRHLRYIADQEKITIDDQALALLAEHSSGGFRDAIGLLDQVQHLGKHITLAEVEQLLGLPTAKALENLLAATIAGDSHQVISQLDQLFANGYNSSVIMNELLKSTKTELLTTADTLRRSRLLKLMHALVAAEQSVNARTAIELALLETTLGFEPLAADKPVVKPAETVLPDIRKKPAATPKPKPSEQIKTPPAEPPEIGDSAELWAKALSQLKGQHNTLYGILRMAEANFTPGEAKLTLAFQFPFHVKRAAEGKHASIIHDILQQISGHDFAIDYKKLTIVPTEAPAADTPPTTMPPEDPLATVREVFGGGEVLED